MSPTNSLRQILAYNIKNNRNKLGLSQEELADLCSLHRTYISDVERCNRNISIDNIEKIALALKIPAFELLMENKNENIKNI